MTKASLSPAEQKVVSLVCEGLTNPEIARRLHVSPRTVSTHLYRVFRKFGVSSRTELAARVLIAESNRERSMDQR